MAGPKKWTEEIIARRVSGGRGQGEGERYSPWLHVQEFSSRGTQTRVPSVRLKRTIHTFSYLERALFLFTEYQQNFADFREQFRMDRRITLGAASSLGIKHPMYPGTKVPVVMTLDAVVVMLADDGRPMMAAWDVKPERQLTKQRVLEKLSLHKAYCAHIGIPHYVFTDKSISRNVIRNIDWMRMSLPKDGECETTPGIFTWHPEQMLEELVLRRRRETLTDFCAQYDASHRLERGTGLRVMKFLLWQRRVAVDLASPHIEREPAPLPSPLELNLSLKRAA